MSMNSPRPFNILGLQQIAVGGLDKQKLRAFWVDLLGLRYGHSYKSEKRTSARPASARSPSRST